MTGYVYPNEVQPWWQVLIVFYPYITGLVAGAFVISALYHVFGRSALKPVSKLALLAALAMLVVAPLPLLLHLEQPFRALNIMLTPNPTSAMAGFGYIYSFYLLIVLMEIWFIFRQDIVSYAGKSSGWVRRVYNVLTLGAFDVSEATLETDHKVAKVLATIGIPSAAFLHGYVGFIFGAIKANPWWSTVLMPVIFLMSAIVSGTAFLIVTYAASSWLRREKIDMSCFMALNKYLWYFLTLDVVLEILEVIHKGYEGRDEWAAVYGLLTEHIPFSFFGVQLVLGAAVPFILLLIARSKRFSVRKQQMSTLVAAFLILVGVFAMRWNVVIGGQLVSKSLMGYTVFPVPLLGKEGILVAVGVLVLPFVILALLVRFLPPWVSVDDAAANGRTAPRHAGQIPFGV